MQAEFLFLTQSASSSIPSKVHRTRYLTKPARKWAGFFMSLVRVVLTLGFQENWVGARLKWFRAVMIRIMPAKDKVMTLAQIKGQEVTKIP